MRNIKYIIVGLIILLVSLQGCNLKSMVSVKAPKDVLAVAGMDSMSLNDQDIVMTKWMNHVEVNTKALQSSLDDANSRYSFIQSIVDVGITNLPINTIPYGGLVLSILTGAAGVLAPQPKFMKKKAKDE